MLQKKERVSKFQHKRVMIKLWNWETFFWGEDDGDCLMF